MRILWTILWGVSLSFSLGAQNGDFEYYDNTYVGYVRTVQFGPDGFPNLFPLLRLGEGGQLLLAFDDMEAGVKNYNYRVIHCDRNWEPSSLASMEYIDGFDEENIRDFDFSFKTLETYTHYELAFPNQDMNITLSGNYLLVVFDDENDRFPIITRRFVVVDQQVAINARAVRPAKAQNIQTHQEVDFSIDFQRINVRNARTELSATVLQNKRWDNAITGIAPQLLRGKEAIFDYQNKIVFEAGNEFRILDLRSLEAPQSNIVDLRIMDEEYIEGELAPMRTRAFNAHLSAQDLNGSYIIDDLDEANTLGDLSGDYVDLMMVYQTGQDYEHEDVYLFSEHTEWQIKPAYKFVYNIPLNAYVGRFPFKQGYHTYYLATSPKKAPEEGMPKVSVAETEGNYRDTENDYLVLAYYRPFGSRYDQVVGALQFNSMR